MALFLSKFINKLDKNGRVSVPAAFRNVLLEQSSLGLVVYPSFVNESIEACSTSRIAYLNQAIDALDPYSEEREAFATAILAGSTQLSFDTEGRIILPEELLNMMDLSEQVCFVGKGETFEIWQPEKFEIYLTHARELAKNKRALLRSNQNLNNN